jgi:hypothetical protein
MAGEIGLGIGMVAMLAPMREMTKAKRFPMRYRPPMARNIHNDTFGPGSICDACGRPNWMMGSEGSVCFHCHAGVCMHRRWWVYSFDAEGGVVATPRENIDLEALRMEWLGFAEQYARERRPVPPLVAEMIRMAHSDAPIKAPAPTRCTPLSPPASARGR